MRLFVSYMHSVHSDRINDVRFMDSRINYVISR